MRSIVVIVIALSGVWSVTECGLSETGLGSPFLADASAAPPDGGSMREPPEVGDSPDAGDDDGGSAGVGDGAQSDAASNEAASGDAASTDAAGTDGAIVDARAPDGCPIVNTGPAMSPVGGAGYCMDTTEVTNAQYAAFVAANPSLTLPVVCPVNPGYAPTMLWPYATGYGDFPVVAVDWCDAYAYCQWAGKRLCGRIGGGSNPQSAVTDPTQSEWYRACSAGGSLGYPYGADYVQGACYGNEPASSPLFAVASFPGCVGGYPGIFDMSGSVWEWEDSCSGETGANDYCQIRGGSLNQNASGLGCEVDTVATRVSAADDRGFRCCAP